MLTFGFIGNVYIKMVYFSFMNIVLFRRGIRNKNPFNIKKSSNPWLGKISSEKEPTFEVFDTLEHGLRAGIKLLVNYIKKGYDTPNKIILRFAPPCENASVNYVHYVVHDDNNRRYLADDDKLTSLDDFCLFCYRVCRYECHLSAREASQLGITPFTIRKIYNSLYKSN